MKLAGDWLKHAGTQGLCAALEAAGYRALFVGGCVRNTLLGRAVDDIDIATDAHPEVVTDLAETAGFKVVPTGIDHGTVTVVAEGRAHEVTTFRRDIQTDGRRAVVAFSDRIEDDAARRDFTMNALYADARGDVADPLNGLPDLLAHRVRFVGVPTERIKEDYLRILRFFRFHAHFADPEAGFDAEGLAACAEAVDGLDGLSKERIGVEMRKILSAPDPAPAVSTMAVSGVLARVLPGADPKSLGPFLHHAETLRLKADPIARLSALGGNNPSDDLRLSRAEARRLLQLRDAATSTQSAAELGYRLGQEDGCAALALRAALFEAPVTGSEDVACGAKARFPVRAADLPHLQGPAVGQALRALEARWIASGFQLTKADLLA